MRYGKRYLLLLFPCLLLMGSYLTVQAQDSIAILDYSIKPVASGSSARFIKIAWEVKLRSDFNKPATVLIEFSFLDEDEEEIAKVTKTSVLKAREERAVSDTVLIRTAEANRIVACDVSVTEQ